MRSKNLSLIALVATAVMVGGERTIIQPGEPLPDLSEKDRDDLVGAKAARERIDETDSAEFEGADTKPSLDPEAGRVSDAPEKARQAAKKGAVSKA